MKNIQERAISHLLSKGYRFIRSDGALSDETGKDKQGQVAEEIIRSIAVGYLFGVAGAMSTGARRPVDDDLARDLRPLLQQSQCVGFARPFNQMWVALFINGDDLNEDDIIGKARIICDTSEPLRLYSAKFVRSIFSSNKGILNIQLFVWFSSSDKAGYFTSIVAPRIRKVGKFGKIMVHPICIDTKSKKITANNILGDSDKAYGIPSADLLFAE